MNAQGRRIHNFVALPPGFDPAKKYPLLVLMHGGHANMWRDSITLRWNYHLLASPGYVVLLTDYRGSTGYGEQFTLDILGDPLRGPADDINQGADEAIKRFPFIDGTRQAAAGASYGGHLANWLEATTDRYKCLVSHAGLSSLQTQWATSDTIHHRELMMGGPFWEKSRGLDRPEPDRPREGLQDPDAALGRRERLPRAHEQHAGDVRGAAADAGPRPAAGLAGREPLDPEGREQPRLLPRGPRLAGAVARIARSVIRGLALVLGFAASAFAQGNPAGELAGLWEALLRFGPDVRGTLTIARDPDGWRGEIAGRSAPARVAGDGRRPDPGGSERRRSPAASTALRR